MSSITDLISRLPEISQSRLVASGFGVWVVWKGKLNNAVQNTLREYGALCVVSDAEQALWFCNTSEVFRALARLQIWAQVNPMPVFCEVIPMTFLVGYEMEFSVSISSELDKQNYGQPNEFEVVIHPKLKEKVDAVASLSTQGIGAVEELAPVEWLGLQADQGKDYETLRKWFYVIKPLGKLADKEAILGWRDFSAEILDLIRQMGLKYVSDIKEGAIFFPLDNFQLLRSFCNEILTLIRSVKEDPDKKYWPVVMAAVSQEGLQFAADLPKKIGLDWNRLVPDFPYLRFMDGFLLSEWFRMSEASYRTAPLSLNSWCTISFKEGGEELGAGTMQVVLPSVLTGNEGNGCYYCGQGNHEAKYCPSKKLPKPQDDIWQRLAKTDVTDFSKGFMELDNDVSTENFSKDMSAVFESKNPLENILSRAVYEINVPSQLRMIEVVWRSQGKEWGEGFNQLVPQEGEFVWDALHLLEAADLDAAENRIKEAQLRYPRSSQPHALWGFWYMEMDDFTQALFHWQEAERLSYTPMQQGYFAYLQARLMEMEGDIKDAIDTYKHANSYSPAWIDPVYRQGVCMVKMGFTGQAMDLFSGLIDRDPNIFNRILIDPELDRGRVQLMMALHDRWYETENDVKKIREKVTNFIKDISRRFDANHAYYALAMAELERLKTLGDTENYVAYKVLMRGAEKFQSRLDTEIRREVKRIDANLEYQSERVREIQKEAAWFPFPKLLLEFNKDFNFCVDKINWIRTQRLKDARRFRKSLLLLDEIEERIEMLQGRLVTLRIVRDSTLFILMLGRNFIWFELVGLGLALISIPTMLYFTQHIQGNWMIDTIREQRWEFTKGLVIILSVLCLVAAALKSTFSFDKRKRELFDMLDEELREAAPRRY